MKWITLLIVVVLFPAVLFSQEIYASDLMNKKASYDSLREANKLNLLVLVRMEHDTALYIISDAEFPDSGIGTTFNILKDGNNKMRMLSVYPYSESGDWFVGFTHYFDEQGNTFAFERLTSFYNSGCTDEMATETIVKYYDSSFKEVKNTYSLTGPDGVTLKKSKCDLQYQFDYTVYDHRRSVLKGNRMPITLE